MLVDMSAKRHILEKIIKADHRVIKISKEDFKA